ncbi:protein PHOTOPERIOD-INDEPENDENT EARLY FLOWERING 1 isoform X1 [Sesamum indicum]|uniref:DNA helicase n=3 Tax=Sesamum TaxID=4181 RepID=A0A6I9SWL0_SESIN|nr:protein PHOTOPERIOD-INDEPENDENT EARLY FLOWERING 1 isoform X1 [Sesamum indicum]XP_011075154.1 protein PHOTOPERIOD-INDEPENDENT EARLY FLOWERING 1 isoform X1 [Sesamum indicum]XP_011075156.1 protein PHOTOPERIOD-INDEPENDENT EARLY FLOWERING 1 isoform X1 [Sesamum indicum]XP_011075157.1 protein PHOTOPERIOD-INDEPENDENT EARLY FLOWERING 1 isoform X1 [Sesamum indicum]
MASKGPRSKLDHESRARRQKALEAPKEPRRPKTHWDHVLEEMVWLSKDFESERKWKLAQAKKVAIRASKGMLDQATRGEKRVKEEEQKLRKLALNISKDVKKFWTKIEKLVLYKHQLELDEKKKKALDKQLEFLLGQTERYSSMLAENLVNSPTLCKSSNLCTIQEQPIIHQKGGDESDKKASESDTGSQSKVCVQDEDYDLQPGDESEDDERTIEEDEALITKEEREEELAALQSEIDLPLEEILKRYAAQEVEGENSPNKDDNISEATKLNEYNGKEDDVGYATEIQVSLPAKPGRRCAESNGILSVSENHGPVVEKYKRRDSLNRLLESEKTPMLHESNDDQEDDDFVLSAGEEKEYDMDDETTLLEEEELANAESNNTVDEIALLQKESEVPIEELIARYKENCDDDEGVEDGSESLSASGSEAFLGSSEQGNSELKRPDGESNGFQMDIRPYPEEDEAECSGKSGEDTQNDDIIADAAAAARSAQPTGNTFSTTKVRTKFPFLLKYPLREYQHIGLDWLVTMYEKRLNGILADEMGLGKTIMTISLLAHLACEKGIWGPHLIVVPTSVMLNWETEFLKWCPAFKILTYFGSAKERRIKRQGWLKPNSFHVCITTYRLVIQDSKVFKRKKWKYLILDEAHLIKNWKSQRWQTLLNFNSKRRILLTGTPLQNDLMELWSLMHFLMPHIFQSHQEFKDWFSNPISGMVEGQEKVNKEVVDRLHNVLRPFILRRLKRDVEKQLPMKHEHVIYCRLSRRQRNLYEDFIASSETQATLASANFFGMISVIMQLRKVCNHPDLFEGRPIVSSFDMSGIDMQLSSSVCSMLASGPFSTVDLCGLGFVFTHLDFSMTSWESEEIQAIATPSSSIVQRVTLANLEENWLGIKHKKKMHSTNIFEDIQKALLEDRLREAKERAAAVAWWNSLRCKRKPMYATGLRELVCVKHPVHDIHCQKQNPLCYLYSSKLADIVLSPVERFRKMVDQVESFMFAIPAARVPPPVCWCSKGRSPVFVQDTCKDRWSQAFFPLLTPFRPAIVRRQVYFPDRRLIQFDCGKLQELAVLLRRLKSEGHRALIFTQMTKMLDILEAFINLYGYTYMRLDGSTQPEERQTLMQRFNTNPKIFLFILSTRSGGVGINLVGADTVIFYDSDWNPAMDQQAQDRCHRIGQTREVHIYRLISESTIEENILKKANQKRALDDLVIQSGSYNTEFFKKLDPMELFSGTVPQKDVQTEKTSNNTGDTALSSVDLEAALKNAEDEADYMALKKVEEEEAVDNQEFTEEGVGKLEDDEFVNEEELKPDCPAEHTALNAKSDEGNVVRGSHPVEEGALAFPYKEDDVDMLADVKQMAAAAAAAGQAILSFENQLRPIDRYAIRFLELWDPIIDKAAIESHTEIEETEWELERIEKLKDDMEAEIDDDEVPLVYESWDADFATEVYKQQVEALAQHQLMEDLEREAQEKEALENGNSDSPRNNISVAAKPKSKKKTKKAKFKSLKKGALVSKSISVKEESSIEPMSIDDDLIDDEMITSPEPLSPCSTQEKKRKPASDDEEQKSRKKSRKLKASELGDMLLYPKYSSKHQNELKDLKICDNGVLDLECKQTNRSRARGKLSIPIMPLKRVFTIKPEKLKKKANVWSKDFFPSPDLWSPKEDAVLCSVVHEYGPNWNLASEILYGMTAGGSYRGRFRHPIHCSERFRELIQRYVFSASDATNNDKAVGIGFGKSLLRVTEDNIRVLLGIASELPDHELLLQKHFFAVLSAAWRDQSRSTHRNKALFSQKGFYPSQKLSGSTINHQTPMGKLSGKMEFTNLLQCGKLIAAALSGDSSCQSGETLPVFNQDELLVARERLDLTLELQEECNEASSLPSVINVSILGPDPPSLKMNAGDDRHFKSAQRQFRTASGTHIDSYNRGESQGFAMGDSRSWTPQLPYLGKHKLPVPDSVKPSKSKLRKTSKDHTDLHCLTTSEVFQPMPLIPADPPSMRFDEFSACLPEAGILEFDSNCFLDMGSEVTFLDTPRVVPFHFGPDLTSGLDDFSILPEFTDIG